jgi:hypothetical protein
MCHFHVFENSSEHINILARLTHPSRLGSPWFGGHVMAICAAKPFDFLLSAMAAFWSKFLLTLARNCAEYQIYDKNDPRPLGLLGIGGGGGGASPRDSGLQLRLVSRICG